MQIVVHLMDKDQFQFPAVLCLPSSEGKPFRSFSDAGIYSEESAPGLPDQCLSDQMEREEKQPQTAIQNIST